MLLLYNALLTLLWPLLHFYVPFRGTIAQRLGRFELGAYDPAAQAPRFLINAVSAGEVVAIAPFIRELKQRLPEAQIVLLTTTLSGQTLAREKLGDAICLLAYFPLVDLPFVVRRYLDCLRPSIYITTEAELWPNIQAQCRARGAPVALVNARLYLHNKRGLRGAVVRRLYELCDLIVCQDARQEDNFRRFGIAQERLCISGNTKFDFALPEWSAEQLGAWQARLGLAAEPVLVAGSTHPGEEELLLDCLVRVRQAQPRLRLILAPRHAARAAEVQALCAARGLSAQKLSELDGPGVVAWWDVLIADRYGVLVDMYRVADLVVLGGTFQPKVGGHNILEATALGKPVLVGPHVFSIAAQVELLAAAGGVAQAQDAAELELWVARLLVGAGQREAMGAAALAATQANRGAAGRAVDAVLALLR